jgi:hypothetical protein
MAAESIVSVDVDGCAVTDQTMPVQSLPAFPEEAVASSTMSSQLPIFPAEDKETRGVTGLLGAIKGKDVAATSLKVAQKAALLVEGHDALIEPPFTVIELPTAGSALLRVTSSCCEFSHAQVGGLVTELEGIVSKKDHKTVDVSDPK